MRKTISTSRRIHQPVGTIPLWPWLLWFFRRMGRTTDGAYVANWPCIQRLQPRWPQGGLHFIERFGDVRCIIESGRREAPSTMARPNVPSIILVFPRSQQPPRSYGYPAIRNPGTVVDGEFRVLRTWQPGGRPRAEWDGSPRPGWRTGLRDEMPRRKD